MMPELKALFDLPRRILPGRGARMHGYGDKRSIADVRASGANGALTLSRSDKPVLTPISDTDEEPTELRAGPGVRLHGYGGIYTLERLPNPSVEEEPTIPRPAILDVEVQNRWGTGRACYFQLMDPQSDGYFVTETTTYYGTIGSYIETRSASGEIQSISPGDTPVDCAAIVFSTTNDGETDYGFITDYDITYSGGVGWGPVEAAARGAIGNYGPPLFRGPFEWPYKDWRAASAVTGRDIWLHDASSFHGPGTGIWDFASPRYRLINTGSANITVDVIFTRTSDSFESTVTTSIGPGETGAWLDFPSITGEDGWTGRIDRIRIGRYS